MTHDPIQAYQQSLAQIAAQDAYFDDVTAHLEDRHAYSNANGETIMLEQCEHWYTAKDGSEQTQDISQLVWERTIEYNIQGEEGPESLQTDVIAVFARPGLVKGPESTDFRPAYCITSMMVGNFGPLFDEVHLVTFTANYNREGNMERLYTMTMLETGMVGAQAATHRGVEHCGYQDQYDLPVQEADMPYVVRFKQQNGKAQAVLQTHNGHYITGMEFPLQSQTQIDVLDRIVNAVDETMHPTSIEDSE